MKKYKSIFTLDTYILLLMIPEVELLMYMRGMEIHSLHYKNVYEKHMNLLGSDSKLPGKPINQEFDSKRKRPEPEVLTDVEREITSNVYGDIRQSMRFTLTRDYTTKFVTDHIHSFEDLLQFGRYMLNHIHQNKEKYIDSCTGVESSLYNEEDW
ncbi:MAG: hypothetical protein WD512_09035, partial [Candidatus Paceibacterota bacterium]